MATLPFPIIHTVSAVYEAHEARAREFGDSRGVPMGQATNSCDRATWYIFRWVTLPEKIDGIRQSRFDTGVIWETRLLDDLELIGCQVDRIDPATGKQFFYELADGWLRGKADGMALGIPEAPKTIHIVEAKSHNEKSFKELLKHAPPNGGGLQKSKLEHFAQLQLYLHASGVTRGLYYAVNKNTDERYAERIPYNAAFCLSLVARIERIVQAAHPPARLHDDPNSKAAFACQWCPALAICHEGAFARVNCRTCLSSSPIGGGRWHCERWDRDLSYAEQQAGCSSHRFLPSLVPGEQEDVIEDDTIVYRLANGSEWLDGAR